MQSIELTSKSVEDALQAAASKLGLPVDSLTATVLEETKGLFGKMQLRIRIDVKELPKAAAKAAPTKAAAAKAEEEPAKPAEKEKAKPAKRGKKEEAVAAPAVETAPADDTPAAEVEQDGDAGQPGVVATEENAQELLDIVQMVLGESDLDVQTKIKEMNGRYVTIELNGKETSFLVGKQGEVLNALQYLTNVIAARKLGNGVRAVLDGGDFRRQREAKLQKMATQLAEEVIKRNQEAVLDALPAFERRIIHKVLSTMDGVSTYSEGEEPNRRLIIAPLD